MFFEALCNGARYQMQVVELRSVWKILLREVDKDWQPFEINKSDFRSLDDTISFLFKNSSYLVDVVVNGNDVSVYTRGSYRNIRIFNDESLLHESLKGKENLSSGNSLTAGMPGKITKVFVKVGDVVVPETPLLIMEAMKMENELRATHKVKINKLCVSQGESVESGALLIEFEPVTD